MRAPLLTLIAIFAGCGGFTATIEPADSDLSASGDDDDQPGPTSISGPGQAPVAADDTFEVDQGSSTALAVSANDSDVDDDIDGAGILLVTLPGRGTAVANADGTIQYTHDGSDTPSDTFSYTISDGNGNVSNEATVTLSVLSVNQPPVANDDVAVVTDGEVVNIDLAANDTDPDDGIAVGTVFPVTMPTHGTLIPLGDGTVDYSHSGDGSAYDSFTYTVEDFAGAESNEATVDITVNPAPQCGGYFYLGSCWYTSASVNQTCNTVCAPNCGFDQAGSQHNGNAIGMYFWPAKANGNSWESIECSSTDNNTNWGANNTVPDEFWSHTSCYVNCACNC